MGTPNTQPLKVYLSDISPHSQAILEFFIGSTGGKSFTLVPIAADAEVYITDFDYPGSREHWEAEHATSAKPCIALSIENPDNQFVEWVAKPITAQSLIAAAAKISSALSNKEANKQINNHSKQGEVTTEPQTKPYKRPPPLPRFSAIRTPFRKQSHVTTPTIHTPTPTFQQGQSTAAIVMKENPTHNDRSNDDVAVAVKTKPAERKSLKPVSITPKVTTEASLETTESAVHTKTVVTEKRTTYPNSNKQTIDAKTTPKDALSKDPEDIKKASLAKAGAAKQRWVLLCGEHENIAHNTLLQNKELNYNCENYFQGTLIAGLRLAKQTKQVVQIKFEPHQFYICYDEYLIFSPLAPETDEYAKLSYTQVKPGQVNLHILSSPESADIRKRINTDANFTYDLESFIWSSCLLTSRGRVPSTLNGETPYLLQYWPNFTRIENFPFAMKIAARWQKKPYKLSTLAREMDIPIRYVIAFYNGAIGLSLFETDSSKIAQKSNLQPTKNKGLIARLFGRLTRNEATTQ